VHGLDHKRAARSEHAQKLGQHLPVAFLAAVAERRKQAEDGIEALVLERQLAEVRLHPPRPLAVCGTPPSLVELNLRAIDGGDAVAGLREWNRVPAKTRRSVEDLGRRFDPGEPGSSESLIGRIELFSLNEYVRR
jgi:hypothetical protein